MGITTLVSQHILTADPAFESVVPFSTLPGTGGLVALYEASGAQEEEGWRCLRAMGRWAICLRPKKDLNTFFFFKSFLYLLF